MSFLEVPLRYRVLIRVVSLNVQYSDYHIARNLAGV